MGGGCVPHAAGSGLTPCLCHRRPGPGAAAAGGRGPRAPAPAPAPGGPRSLPDVPAAALRAAHRLPGGVRLRRRRGGRCRQEQQQELQHRRPAAEGPQARRGPGALTRFPRAPLHTPPRVPAAGGRVTRTDRRSAPPLLLILLLPGCRASSERSGRPAALSLFFYFIIYFCFVLFLFLSRSPRSESARRLRPPATSLARSAPGTRRPGGAAWRGGDSTHASSKHAPASQRLLGGQSRWEEREKRVKKKSQKEKKKKKERKRSLNYVNL